MRVCACVRACVRVRLWFVHICEKERERVSECVCEREQRKRERAGETESVRECIHSYMHRCMDVSVHVRMLCLCTHKH